MHYSSLAHTVWHFLKHPRQFLKEKKLDIKVDIRTNKKDEVVVRNETERTALKQEMGVVNITDTLVSGDKPSHIATGTEVIDRNAILFAGPLEAGPFINYS